ncbi:hypothetical protein ACDW34_08790 [Acinetobacter piscicola]|uniref:DUF7940 domain-containing protein n=1 Tax=Acinetobacter piscicola TaxID=2006115 RepID=UPI0035571E9D
MGKQPTRKVPQSIKVQRRIDDAVQAAIADKDKQLLNQAKRHQKRVEMLEGELAAASAQFVSAELVQHKVGWLVENWRKGWLWLSNWVFAAIGYIAVFGIPPEVMALLPVESQTKVIAILSVLGVIFRFINQSKPKPLPELKGDIDDFAA